MMWNTRKGRRRYIYFSLGRHVVGYNSIESSRLKTRDSAMKTAVLTMTSSGVKVRAVRRTN